MENVPAQQLIVLLEEVAESSRQISQENCALRAELEKRDRAQSQAYENLEKKIQDLVNLSTGAGKNNRRRRYAQEARVVVPVQCRVSLKLTKFQLMLCG